MIEHLPLQQQLSDLSGQLERAEAAEAREQALQQRVEELEAALVEADDTPAWIALKLCKADKKALRDELIQHQQKQIEFQQAMLDAEEICDNYAADNRALQQQLYELRHREQVLRQALKWMDRKGGFELGVHDRIRAALSAHKEGE